MKKIIIILSTVICGIIILFGLIISGLYLAAPKPKAPPKIINTQGDIDNYLKKLTDNQTPPAISITILKNGKSVYSKAFGYADFPQKETAQLDTIYPWWSVTKIFTAAAIMQLYEKKKLDLDDPLDKYITEFKVKNKNGIGKTITIRQLLTHRSGLKDLMPEGLTWIRLADKPKPNQTDFFKEKIKGKYQILKFEPDTKTGYTSIGYLALGVVIETITGIEYEEYVFENILKPLNMKTTSFIRNKELQSKTATGSNPVMNLFTGLLWLYGEKGSSKTYARETLNGRIWFQPLYTNYTPSTGLSGTSEEMARIGLLFLQGGIFNNQRILTENSINKMLISYNPDELGNSYNDELYGLGWKTWKINNQIVYGHGGGGPGFGALLVIIPECELVIAINANDTNINREALVKMLASFKW